MRKGSFIVVEGLDGAGKSTAVKFVEQALFSTDGGNSTLVVREPGGTPFAEDMRSVLLARPRPHEINSVAEVGLFLAARASHIHDVIIPHTQSGATVICDRWNWSTMSYQGFGGELDRFKLANAIEFFAGSITPDLTIFMDVMPHVGIQRVTDRPGRADYFESLPPEYHERVEQGYRFCYSTRFGNPKHVARVNANEPLASVKEQIAVAVNGWRNKTGH